jgi:hypothetical protein
MEWPYPITRLFSLTNLLICHSYQQFLKITEYFMVTTFKMLGVAQHTPAGPWTILCYFELYSSRLE